MSSPQRKRRRIVTGTAEKQSSTSINCTSSDEMASSVSKMRVVLILCGSMNPITNLHLRMFEVARDSLHHTNKFTVEKGIISPVHDSYGKKGLITSDHRLAMTELAIKNSDWIKLDPWECHQEAWLPTKRVLDHYQEVVSSETEGQTKVKLLCGADLLESFATPGLWAPQDIQDIVGKYGLVVISRYGHNPEKFIYESDNLTPLKNNIHIATEWIPNDVSSTKIRRSLRRGESVKYLISDDVIGYIKQHNLYQSSDDEANSSTSNST